MLDGELTRVRQRHRHKITYLPGPGGVHRQFGAPKSLSPPVSSIHGFAVSNRRGRSPRPPLAESVNPYRRHSFATYKPGDSIVPFAAVSQSIVISSVVQTNGVGDTDGAVDGLCVGKRVGDSLGDLEGLPLGESVGDFVGDTVGLEDGKSLGDDVGDIVGLSVGDDDGEAVGSAVGARVGAAVGAAVGFAVGLSLGATVGDFVGFSEGDDVG